MKAAILFHRLQLAGIMMMMAAAAADEIQSWPTTTCVLVDKYSDSLPKTYDQS